MRALVRQHRLEEPAHAAPVPRPRTASNAAALRRTAGLVGNQNMRALLAGELARTPCSCAGEGTCTSCQAKKLLGGSPLPTGLRSSMEASFGVDLAGVKVHTGASAAESAQTAGAKAYATGRDIVFGHGAFTPGTLAGRKSVAHELAHVLQQSNQNGRSLGYEAAEAEASAASEAAAAGRPARVEGRWSGGIQRQVRTVEEIEADLARNELALQNPAIKLGSEAYRKLEAENLRLKAEITAAANNRSPAPAPGKEKAKAEKKDQEASADSFLSFGYIAEVVGEFELGSPGSKGSLGGAAPFLGGGLGASGVAALKFLNPKGPWFGPGAGTWAPDGPGFITRFAGVGRNESFFDPNRLNLNRDLTPRRWQAGTSLDDLKAIAKADEILANQHGLTSHQINELAARLKKVGFQNLTGEEQAVLRRMTNAHAQINGLTRTSPFLSATELSPDKLFELADQGKVKLNVATERAYIVRVKVDPSDMARVNEILSRTAKNSAQMVNELEVVVAKPLTPGGGPGQPRILSITANPRGPLGGMRGAALRWGGRGMVVLGAGVAVHEILTAEGSHKRETQGRAFGSFAGGTVLGALGAGFCVGAGIATGGVALLLCGLGAGLAGAGVGGLAGGGIGSLFD